MKEVRPTSGKVLQALFNILGDKVSAGSSTSSPVRDRSLSKPGGVEPVPFWPWRCSGTDVNVSGKTGEAKRDREFSTWTFGEHSFFL